MLAKTPPMGWNSWDCHGAGATEEIVKKNAEYMAKNLKQYGYEYVVVDIQWYQPTAKTHDYVPFADLCIDEYSRLQPAENKFPSAAGGKGFAPLAEYVHSLGLKFGIHIMRGIPRQAVHNNLKILGSDKTARQIAKTGSICVWNSDMYGVDPEKDGAKEYYDSIMKLYASWGVDFIKCDDICRELPHEESEMKMLCNAVKNCGRDIVLSLSPGPALIERAELYKQVCNMWRITDDFWDQWELLYNMFERCEKWATHCGAGHWGDADMLPVGAILQDYDESNRTKFTEDEQKTMMTLWCIFRSPLMIGSELTKLDTFTSKLLTNNGILDMHKNARHSHQVWRKEIGGTEHILWAASCSEGGEYLAIFNAGEKDSDIILDLEDIEIYKNVNAQELWSGEKLTGAVQINTQIKAHGAKAYLITY